MANIIIINVWTYSGTVTSVSNQCHYVTQLLYKMMVLKIILLEMLCLYIMLVKFDQWWLAVFHPRMVYFDYGNDNNKPLPKAVPNCSQWEHTPMNFEPKCKCFTHVNTFENDVWEMLTNLSLPQCIKDGI